MPTQFLTNHIKNCSPFFPSLKAFGEVRLDEKSIASLCGDIVLYTQSYGIDMNFKSINALFSRTTTQWGTQEGSYVPPFSVTAKCVAQRLFAENYPRAPPLQEIMKRDCRLP